MTDLETIQEMFKRAGVDCSVSHCQDYDESGDTVTFSVVTVRNKVITVDNSIATAEVFLYFNFETGALDIVGSIYD